MKKQTKLIVGLALSVISLCFSILLLTDAIPTSPKQPKYIFYFIGDGMSFNHILGAEQYNAVKEGKSEVERLCFSKFETRNFVTNYSASNPVTDSAAAGTALATGVKTANAYIGVDAEGNDTSAPIVFSEWTLIGGTQMQRSDYTMSDLLLYNDSSEGNLFALTEEQKEEGGIFLRRYITYYKKVQDYGE